MEYKYYGFWKKIERYQDVFLGWFFLTKRPLGNPGQVDATYDGASTAHTLHIEGY